MKGNSFFGGTSGTNKHLIPWGGVGCDIGRVGKPALLNGECKIGHSIDMAAHIDFVSNCRLQRAI